MGNTTFAWLAFVLYAIFIIYMAFRGIRKAKSLESFAVGTRDVSPILVGVSLSANMTSAATFVINPGLIYLYGISGFMGYAIAAPLGIFLGLIVMSKAFRKIGDRTKVLTVPQWIGDRYQNKNLTIFYAFLSLLQITFLVLIVVGLSLVLKAVLQIHIITALLIVIIFTFTYILLGGASAHILTNFLQGMIMLVVALLLIGSGFPYLKDGLARFLDLLRSADPHLVGVTNPTSLLFRDFFEVFIANFIIGIAIICQPHIISKALYLKSERDTNKYLGTTVVIASIFFMVLVAGLYARVLMPAPNMKPDTVIPTYIVKAFDPRLGVLITVGILSAGFSTMEGLLVAISSIFSNDFYLNVFSRNLLKNKSAEERKKSALRFSKIFLIALAPITFFLSYDQILHPKLSVAIFAQNGVYGLFSATFVPIIYGIFARNVNKWVVFASSVTALIVHFGMYYGGITHYHTNPAVPATFALIISTSIVGLHLILTKGRKHVSH